MKIIAQLFCDELKFFGVNKSQYEQEWNSIEFARYYKNKPEIEKVMKAINKLRDIQQDLLKEYNNLNKPLILWENKKQRKLHEEINELDIELYRLRMDLEYLQSHFYDKLEIFKEKAHSFLLNNNFKLVAEVFTNIEIWELEI